MPVVFLCPNCKSRLKVTRKKIGTRIECPRCQAPQTVPTQDNAAAAVAMHQAALQPPPVDDPFPEFAVFDEPVTPLEQITAMSQPTAPPPIEEEPLPPPPKSPPETKKKRKAKKPPPEQAEPSEDSDEKDERQAVQPQVIDRQQGSSDTRPAETKEEKKSAATPSKWPAAAGIIKSPSAGSSHGDLLLISRRTLYFQAVLICLVGVAGLLGGFLIGRGFGPVGKGPVDSEPTVQIVGTITYRNAEGEETPDFGAVAIALPADKRQELPIARLGPDSPRDADRVGELAIEELGGAYGRTDGLGGFVLTLPKPGSYFVLLISKNARRPQGTAIAANHLQQMRPYAEDPAALIGQSKYVWVRREVQDARLAVAHVF